MINKIVRNTIPSPYGAEVEAAVLSILPDQEGWWAWLDEKQLDPTYFITVKSPDGHEFTETFFGVEQDPGNIAAVLKAKIPWLN